MTERRIDPLLGAELLGGNGNGLVAIGLAVHARRHEVAKAAAAEEVAQADEAITVPREKYRAASRLAVVLGEHPLRVPRDVELALHDSVGPVQMDEVDGFLPAQPENDRADRLGKTGIRGRVVIGNMNPLPFDDHPRADGMRVRSHQLGLDPPVATELQRQPVVTVAQVPSQGRCSSRAHEEEVGKWVADQVRQGQPRHAGRLQGHGQLARAKPLAPLVARPDERSGTTRSGTGVGRPQSRRDRADHPGQGRPRSQTAIPEHWSRRARSGSGSDRRLSFRSRSAGPALALPERVPPGRAGRPGRDRQPEFPRPNQAM